MAPSSRYSDQDGGERSRRRVPAKSAGPPLVPILALVFVIVGAIIAARFIASNKQEVVDKPKVDPSSVYGDLPEDLPPVPGQRRSGSTNRAPEGLASNPLWVETLRIVEEADAVFDKAKEAKAANNHSEWNKLGNEAKVLYDKALEKSALWEEELQEKYGDTDRQVREIMHMRTKWFQITAALHKTTGRS